MSEPVPVRRALISVYDKEGLVEFATRLVGAGVTLVSSGGSAQELRRGGIEVIDVSSVTGFPEMMGGRVKTLHPAIHAGILGRPEDFDPLAEQGIEPFQLVVSNLYPFAETVASGASEEEIIEKIDVGGPAMVRAAAKNQRHVGVVTSPSQYDEVASEIESGGLTAATRLRLAGEAFALTAGYDGAIASWLRGAGAIGVDVTELRYGENPHQRASLQVEPGARPWWLDAIQHQGKEMSFNNYLDAEAAWRLATDLPDGAVVIVKHTNPCGVAVGESGAAVFGRAWDCDPLSAFGGVVAINGTLDEETARLIAERFVEVVVARSVEPKAIAALAAKGSLRLLEASPPRGGDLDIRRLEMGYLVQDRDRIGGEEWKQVSRRAPSEGEADDLRLAWLVAAHTKSNAIVIVRHGAAVGVGAGDQSRVGAAERAVARAGDRAAGAVAASDGFFPFADGLETLAAAGVTAVVEPGGSRRDDEVIAAADRLGVALVFTGVRHFRH